MRQPAMTVLLCTVRPDNGYLEHPEWSTIGKVLEDLVGQTFQDFELVIVDGRYGAGRALFAGKGTHFDDSDPQGFHARFMPAGEVGPFPVWHVPPRETIWTRNKKVAISTYRNSGLLFARGKWVVNLDDCCVLPPDYLELFHTAHVNGQALGACWNNHPARPYLESLGGAAQIDLARGTPPIHGFGSYPLDVVLNKLNGYDEAYDGGQGHEDTDFGYRLLLAGVPYWLVLTPGLLLPAQGPHDPAAIDLKEPVVKCPNAAWQIQRMQRKSVRVNCDWPQEWLEKLVSPCWLLNGDGTCQHHRGMITCAYLETFAKKRHPLVEQWLREPPVFDLARMHRETQQKVADFLAGW